MVERGNGSEPIPNNEDRSRRATGPVGIDNRGESVKRYGDLEEEGYARHHHGNREGERQRGRPTPDIPVERTTPMANTRYRKDANRTEEQEDEVQYGGDTFETKPGDRDIIGGKKPGR